jgi:hypothetical protein
MDLLVAASERRARTRILVVAGMGAPIRLARRGFIRCAVRGGVVVGISLFPVRIFFVEKGLWGGRKVYVPPYSKLQQAASLGVVACLQDLIDRIFTLDELK